MDQDCLLSPLAEDELVGIREFLRGQGFQPKTVGAGLQCDLPLMGQRCAVLYFYPAERLLAVPQGAAPAREIAMRPLWDELFYDEYRKNPRPDQYLYAVGGLATLAELSASGMLDLVESSQSYARKFVCQPHELPALLSSPFPVMSHEFRANPTPTLHLLRELQDDPQAVASVTHWLTPSANAWQGRKPSEMGRRRAAALYGRIMGRGFALRWENDDVRLMNGSSGVSVEYASRGEQAGFTLACGLANAAAYVAPGLTLGVQALLPCLDAMKQLAALDQMRAFMADCGVSFVIQTANTTVLQRAQSKFKCIAPAQYR